MDGEFLRAMKNIDKTLKRIVDALEKQTAPSVDGKELFERIIGDLASFSVSCFELKNALDQAPSKLKHRALYCKRWRIRKKYLDRIQREYREKKEG